MKTSRFADSQLIAVVEKAEGCASAGALPCTASVQGVLWALSSDAALPSKTMETAKGSSPSRQPPDACWAWVH